MEFRSPQYRRAERRFGVAFLATPWSAPGFCAYHPRKLADPIDASRQDGLAASLLQETSGHGSPALTLAESLDAGIEGHCDAVGIFPNDEAIVPLVGALMHERNDELAVARR